MKINQFDTSNLKEIRTEIDNALKSVSDKFKISLKVGNITYSANEFRAKLEAAIQTSNASGMSTKQIKAIENLRNYGDMFDVSEKDLNKTFTSGNRTFKFVGLMPSRPKFPVLAEDVKTNKLFKFNESVLKQLK